MNEVAVELSAGTVAGATSVLVDYPLDTLKTRMQVLVVGAGSGRRTLPLSQRQQPQHWVLSSERGAPRRSAPRRAGGARDYAACVRGAWQDGGFLGFYRGISVPFLAQGLENAVVFSVFSATQRSLEPIFAARRASSAAPPGVCVTPAQKGELWCAAATAGAAVSVILTPVEFVKGNLQVSERHGARRIGVLSFSKEAYRCYGLSGFYTGFTGTCLRAITGNVAYFLTYKQLIHALCGSAATTTTTAAAPPDARRHGEVSTPRHRPSTWQCVLAGGVSGAVYWSVCYPLDLAKTREQIRAGSSVSRCGGSRQSFPTEDLFPHRGQVRAMQPRGSLVRAMGAIYREGGMRALYRGWCVTMARAFLSSAVVFTVYEHVQASLAATAATPLRDEPARRRSVAVPTLPSKKVDMSYLGDVFW